MSTELSLSWGHTKPQAMQPLEEMGQEQPLVPTSWMLRMDKHCEALCYSCCSHTSVIWGFQQCVCAPVLLKVLKPGNATDKNLM